jgi:hypothetical protein
MTCHCVAVIFFMMFSDFLCVKSLDWAIPPVDCVDAARRRRSVWRRGRTARPRQGVALLLACPF